MNGVLAIDTASSSVIALCSLAAEGVVTRSWPGLQNHSRQLITAIDELLRRAARPSGIAVTIGPGSFAGLRVGIATAESLALGWDVPVYGVSTFEAINRAAVAAGEFIAVHPAGRGEFACQRFRERLAAGAPFLASTEALRGGDALVGEEASAMGGLEVTAEERVAGVAAIAEERMAAGKRPEGLEAFYLREPNITRPKRTPLAANSDTARAGRQ